MKDIKLEEPLLLVEITEPTQEQKNAVVAKTFASDSGRVWVYNKCKILHTFSEDYPVGSDWILNGTKGTTVNIFGKRYIQIRRHDLIGKI